ncbi:hypothetical protein VP01_2g4 [Puccinia sorghi]|uniref:Uncharacterized protein n=1 Tax=Puccinia sorghi TaxID=27349 RepID=A0A0L6V0E8_9BASI|nr:hypothetical protein VP01_2g4 [Puccinia sorghi]
MMFWMAHSGLVKFSLGDNPKKTRPLDVEEGLRSAQGKHYNILGELVELSGIHRGTMRRDQGTIEHMEVLMVSWKSSEAFQHVLAVLWGHSNALPFENCLIKLCSIFMCYNIFLFNLSTWSLKCGSDSILIITCIFMFHILYVIDTLLFQLTLDLINFISICKMLFSVLIIILIINNCNYLGNIRYGDITSVVDNKKLLGLWCINSSPQGLGLNHLFFVVIRRAETLEESTDWHSVVQKMKLNILCTSRSKCGWEMQLVLRLDKLNKKQRHHRQEGALILHDQLRKKSRNKKQFTETRGSAVKAAFSVIQSCVVGFYCGKLTRPSWLGKHLPEVQELLDQLNPPAGVPLSSIST